MVQAINEYLAQRPSIFIVQCQHRPARTQTCDGLTEAIKNLGSGWWQCFDSTWLVMTAKTIDQVRDALAPHLAASDRLMVLAYGENAAFAGFSDLHVAWLLEHPSSRRSADRREASAGAKRRVRRQNRRSECLAPV
jgi:hypothetical protein